MNASPFTADARSPSSSARRSFPTTLRPSWTPSRARRRRLQSSRGSTCAMSLPAPSPRRARRRAVRAAGARCERDGAPRGAPRQVPDGRSRPFARAADTRQFHSPELDDLLGWAARDHGRWPVIAKPLRSVASDAVAVCRTDAELGRAHEAIAGRTNVLGGGTSRSSCRSSSRAGERRGHGQPAGHHRVAALWRYHRPPRRTRVPGVFYDAIELLPYEGERQKLCSQYAVGVLEALEIRYGPAHTEMIWANGEGPVLVETGARLSAGNNATISRLCGGPCALDLDRGSVPRSRWFPGSTRSRASRRRDELLPRPTAGTSAAVAAPSGRDPRARVVPPAVDRSAEPQASRHRRRHAGRSRCSRRP